MSRFRYRTTNLDYTQSFEAVRQYVGQYNRYIERYIAFIQSRAQLNKTRTLDPQSRHDHHIVPVSWGGETTDNNMIPLTFKEHIIAHHLLYYTDDPSMIAAYYSMANIAKKTDIKYNITANQYQILQEKMKAIKSANSKRNMANPEIRAKISNALKGKWVGEKASRKRAVINCDTGEVFATARMADDHYGWKRGVVSDGLANKHLSRGYRFEYYDVYVANGNKPTPFPKYESCWKGKKRTEEQKRQISETLKAKNLVPHNRQKIINLDTGEVYESMCQVAEQHNINKTTLASSFYKARKKGHDVCKCCGYLWKYFDENDRQCIEALNKK